MIAERLLSATYRLQLHKEFGFADVSRIADYLHRLGVSHVYSSPILRARPGSMHGYDVADPTTANPELGGDQERVAMIDALHQHDLGLILDIVPNHMGTGPANPYWEDLLTHGQASAFARWFDVAWESSARGAPGRIHLAVLGDELDSVLARGELGLVWENGALRISYFDDRFPTDPASVPLVIGVPEGEQAKALSDADHRELRETLLALDELPPHSADAATPRGARRTRADQALRRLAALIARSAPVRAHVERGVGGFSTGPAGLERMRGFLDAQPYRLAFWRTAARDLNYRRFFDINELVALRMEDPEVFEETHECILEWIADGSLDGLRIDHIDGLRHPGEYLSRLRSSIRARGKDRDGNAFPIFVEKILSPLERLCEEWPVQGTTGYEFLNDLEAVFVDATGQASIARFYAALSRLPDFGHVAYQGKMRVLQTSLAADVTRLSRLLWPLAVTGRRTQGLGRGELRRALIEFIACLPVYRTYVDPETGESTDEDRAVIERTVRRVVEQRKVPLEAIELLRAAMLLPSTVAVGGWRDRPIDTTNDALAFVARLQQTSGPATAKGVEDTALYVHHALASLNEVGGDPERRLDRAISVLHDANEERQRLWPRALICTNTHDTKRSADLRARLDVLAEMPDRWERAVLRWRSLNRSLRCRLRGRMAPDVNTEYLFYQTLVGVWPVLEAGGARDDADTEELRDRVLQYMLKAAREAKRFTSWTDPDEQYEQALKAYVEGIFSRGISSPFLTELVELVREIARPGLWNVLSRTLLHLASPGTPDIYQGDELWSLALVDPDNRRPVDFDRRARMLGALERSVRRGNATPVELVRDMIRAPEDGRVKLHLIWRVLHCRREWPALFQRGAYEPLGASGERARNVVAFARAAGRDAAVAVATRLPYGMVGAHDAPVGREVWGETRIGLPPHLAGRRWRCQLSGLTVEAAEGRRGGFLEVGGVLEALPVALLTLQ